jgi:hypothetical protein
LPRITSFVPVNRGGAVDGGSPSKAGDRGGGGAGRRGLDLPKANLIVVPSWLSPSGLGGVVGIKIDLSSCSGVAALVFPRLAD